MLKKSHAVKKIIDERKVYTEELFFNGFDIFLARFFLN